MKLKLISDGILICVDHSCSSTFQPEVKKLKNNDFAHFFEDGIKLKIPSKIKPPLKMCMDSADMKI